MSHILDELLVQAGNEQERTVTLSPESVAVFLYATSFLDSKRNWLDTENFPLDEITDADWDTIEKLVGNMVSEVYTPVPLAIVGEVRQFGLSTPPDGWLECDGSSVAIATYPELYAAIGSNFGFPVGGNFKLPDMRFRSPVGLGDLDYDPAFTIGLGQKPGNAEVALAVANIPAHKHQLNNNNGVPRFRHSGTAGANASDGVLAGTSNNATPITTTDTGSGTAFEIVPPIIGLLTCIYAGE